MKLLLLLSLLTSFNVYAKGDFVKNSFAVDFIHEQPLNDGSSADKMPKIRGAEFMFYGAIDHNFEGNLTLASHQVGDEMRSGIHEAYIMSSKLLPHSKLKIGKFFVSLGRLNAIHQHDWDFTITPVVYEKFFGGEGALDSGIEYSYLLPSERFQELMIGVTYGELGVHNHTEEETEEEAAPKSPAFYLKYSTFFENAQGGGLLLGLNALAGNLEDFHNYKVFGFDLTYKSRSGKTTGFQFESELYVKSFDNLHSHESTNAFMKLETKKLIAGYMNFLWGINESLEAGFLVDYFTKVDATNPGESTTLSNKMFAITPYLTFISSEFMKVRMSVSLKKAEVESVTAIDDQRAMLQFVYILGDHPAHNF